MSKIAGRAANSVDHLGLHCLVRSVCPNTQDKYGKCPKVSYIKVSNKMAYANSADPDQTAPEGAV